MSERRNRIGRASKLYWSLEPLNLLSFSENRKRQTEPIFGSFFPFYTDGTSEFESYMQFKHTSRSLIWFIVLTSWLMKSIAQWNFFLNYLNGRCLSTRHKRSSFQFGRAIDNNCFWRCESATGGKYNFHEQEMILRERVD